MDTAKSRSPLPLSQEDGHQTVSDTDSDSSILESSSSSSFDAEWVEHIETDGSLMYMESYVSSTIKEKQTSLKSESDKKLPTISPTKNIKHHTKLLNLLKRRPSVRVKNQQSSSNDANKNSPLNTSNDSSTPKVTFRDNANGEVRKVVLTVNENASNFGRRASICEIILGIMPGRFSEPPDSRVMVAGLAPGSQALKDGIIKIGDWLKNVESKEVTWENLNDVLREIQIPSTVTLLVQKCASETVTQGGDIHSEERITQTQLMKFISGTDTEMAQEWSIKAQRGDLPLHTVLYLSLRGVNDESKDRDDIKYQFPAFTNKLVDVRGMFITASHSLQEAIGTPVLSCSVILEGEYYNVGFSREENDVFMIALPNFCLSKLDMIPFMNQVSKLIFYEFGSLYSAFSQSCNHSYLDHLFLMVFENLLAFRRDADVSGQSVSPSLSETISCKSSLLFASPSWLILKDKDAKIQVETCLNEFDSGDFGGNDSDCEDCQLLYNIIGCCIFYKNHLVNSHLDDESLKEIYLYLHHHRLLQLINREAVSQLVIWRRIYPQQGEFASSNRDFRHYILVVAMNHMLLATLLESGNVTELLDEKAGPDPFLVDQAETTLYHLHSLHVHSACQESLSYGSIETSCLEEKLKAKTPQKKNKQKSKEPIDSLRPPDVPSILKQKSEFGNNQYQQNPTGEFAPCDCEKKSLGESEDSSFLTLPEDEEEREAPEEDDSSDSEFQIWKGSDTRSGYGYSPKVRTTKDPSAPLRITVGADNVLLHFLKVDSSDGVLVTSGGDCCDTSLHSTLVQNFYSACSHIRHILHSSTRNQIIGNYSPSTILNVKEYGIMFDCTFPPTDFPGSSKKKNQTISYWVIGRVYKQPYEREIYVAIEESIPQNIQEIAFKLSLSYP